MTDDLKRIEDKLDEVIDALPMLRALGAILVRRSVATDGLDLNKNTIGQNANITKYEEVGHRRTFVEIGEVAVVQKRAKKTRKRFK